TEENSRSQLWARAAEPIARTNTVLVEHRTDVEILQADVAVINPETGNAFVFRHVDPDAAPSRLLPAETLQAASEGTVEDPLSTVAQAANLADANADNIIFVQEGNVGGGFTLPDGVQVRSAGPVQQLATQFGDITLPGSGSGNLPTVTGTVTVGNNALVSGLNIDPSASALEEALAPAAVTAAEVTEAQAVANGIVARGENITLEDNVIANVNQGIDLPDIDGTVSIVRNQISNTLSDGIFFGDIEGEDNATVTVANNTLDTVGGEGIEFGLIQGNAIANITVANNQITDAQVDSIFFDDIQQDAIATIVA
ncbi:MAG: right-handed parallel beta-helix repeat-containing protein, partial [Cyanobacteria bacterium J06607_6]